MCSWWAVARAGLPRRSRRLGPVRQEDALAGADELAVFAGGFAGALVGASRVDAGTATHAGEASLVGFERLSGGGVLGHESAGVFRRQGKKGVRPSKAA
jgi:hypothetical protein